MGTPCVGGFSSRGVRGFERAIGVHLERLVLRMGAYFASTGIPNRNAGAGFSKAVAKDATVGVFNAAIEKRIALRD